MEQKSKRPMAVYTVINKGEGKDVWLRVGSAFENRDGSTSVILDALPVGGRLQIREYQPKELGQSRSESDASSRAEPTARVA